MKNRMLHPAFFSDSELAETLGFAGRIFYAGLWCVAEDSAVFAPNLKDLRNQIFPSHDATADEIRDYYEALVAMRKVIEYRANGRVLAWIKNFHDWQRLQNPTPPRLPLPPWMRWVEVLDEKGKVSRSKSHYEVDDGWDFSQDPPRPRKGGKGDG